MSINCAQKDGASTDPTGTNSLSFPADDGIEATAKSARQELVDAPGSLLGTLPQFELKMLSGVSHYAERISPGVVTRVSALDYMAIIQGTIRSMSRLSVEGRPLIDTREPIPVLRVGPIGGPLPSFADIVKRAVGTEAQSIPLAAHTRINPKKKVQPKKRKASGPKRPDKNSKSGSATTPKLVKPRQGPKKSESSTKPVSASLTVGEDCKSPTPMSEIASLAVGKKFPRAGSRSSAAVADAVDETSLRETALKNCLFLLADSAGNLSNWSKLIRDVYNVDPESRIRSVLADLTKDQLLVSRRNWDNFPTLISHHILDSSVTKWVDYELDKPHSRLVRQTMPRYLKLKALADRPPVTVVKARDLLKFSPSGRYRFSSQTSSLKGYDSVVNILKYHFRANMMHDCRSKAPTSADFLYIKVEQMSSRTWIDRSAIDELAPYPAYKVVVTWKKGISRYRSDPIWMINLNQPGPKNLQYVFFADEPITGSCSAEQTYSNFNIVNNEPFVPPNFLGKENSGVISSDKRVSALNPSGT